MYTQIFNISDREYFANVISSGTDRKREEASRAPLLSQCDLFKYLICEILKFHL